MPIIQQRHEIPVEVSARHAHLSREHLDILFGPGYELAKLKDLSQIGQFAAAETITIEGLRGKFEKVRLIGPCREHTQVEISRTDARLLGIEPPVRLSGDISSSSGARLSGPQGTVELGQGVIIAQRHLHLDEATAEQWSLKSGDVAAVEIGGERGAIFNNVAVRVHNDFMPAFHIDTDEANAAGITANNNHGYVIAVSGN